MTNTFVIAKYHTVVIRHRSQTRKNVQRVATYVCIGFEKKKKTLKLTLGILPDIHRTTVGLNVSAGRSQLLQRCLKCWHNNYCCLTVLNNNSWQPTTPDRTSYFLVVVYGPHLFSLIQLYSGAAAYSHQHICVALRALGKEFTEILKS